VVRDDDNSRRAAKYRGLAGEARRMADSARTPAERADLRQVEKRWLKLARSHEARTQTPSPRKSHRKERD
jgi:hypothetical protein